MARKLVVEIVGDSRSLERAFTRSNRAAKNFNQDMTRRMSGTVRATRGLAGALTGLGAGFIGLAGAGLLVREAFGEMAQAQKVTAQTEAVLKSTGGAAGVTASQIEFMAESLMQLSGADDEVIQSGANMLLTFRNIRNETGRGRDIFTQATAAALDMSFALGKDMRTSALQLGKALNDPIRGITALRRSGVQFTKAQERQIKSWVETGQVVRAQTAILREVTAEFGGSARAAGDTLPGKLNILRESLRNLAGEMAQNLAPRITEVVDRLNEWLADPDNQRRVVEDFSKAVRGLADAFVFLKDAIAGTKDAIDDVSGFFERNRLGFLNQGLRESGRDLNDWISGQLGGINLLGIRDAGEKAGTSYTLGFNRAVQEHLDIVGAGHQIEQRAAAAGAAAAARAARIIAAARARAERAAAEARQRGITRGRTVFDASITRRLDRLQDVSLRKQLAGLRQIAQAIRDRIAATKDLTRRLNLEDKLLAVLRQQRSVQAEITDQIRAANEALKDRADAIKSAVIERLQARQTDILNKRALREAREQLRIARQLGGRGAIRTATERVQDVQADMRIARLERQPATLTATGRFAFAGVVINIHGVTDPAAVANRVAAILKKRGRHTSTQIRPTAAASA